MRGLSFIVMILITVLVSSCGEVTIEVDKLPSNTPKGDLIFLAGNVNYWDPGDPRYTLTLKNDSSGYYITIPKGFGNLEYKFTRGDWKSVEVDRCGFSISNRSLSVFQDDTVIHQIGSWKDLKPADCEYVTLVIDDLPENTPDDEPITLAGDFNQWGLTDTNFQFLPDGKGRRILKLIKPRGVEEIEFKVMRGNLSTVETDEFGNELVPRKLDLNEADSMFLTVKNWSDQVHGKLGEIELVIPKLPASTPPDAAIFLATNLNNWYPRSENFKFTKQPNGTYTLTLPHQPLLEFKVTRGSWENVEVDAFGNEIPNRVIAPINTKDTTVKIEVQAWKDMTPFEKGSVFFLVEVPPTTDGENVYMPNSFNDWDENDRSYRLKQLGENQYGIAIEKRFKRMHFKFVREGDWESVEVDAEGREMENRWFAYRGEDTVRLQVANWRDKAFDESPTLTLVIDKVPEYTPKEANIYLAAEFTGNYWSANDRDYRFEKTADGTYYLTIKKSGQGFDFKFTRGEWDLVEADKKGYDIPNRFYQFSTEDTAYFQIAGWKGQK